MGTTLAFRLQTLNSNYTRFFKKNQVKNHHAIGIKYWKSLDFYDILYPHWQLSLGSVTVGDTLLSPNHPSCLFASGKRQQISVKHLYYN